MRVDGLLQPGDPEFIGPYRVVKPLGRGGMGRVFLAVSPGGRPVAVKVVHPEYADDREFRIRFRREVEAARKVSGLCTAEVVDADTDGPIPWLATAYVPGPSLMQAIKEHGPLPLPSLIALAAGLAEGIGVIHAAGVVHRDLTSNNVLIAEDGPRIIDFGISQAADATIHTHSTRFGTPGYHPPELLASSGHVAAAGDIFSLGAVLAFAATGTNPFGSGPSEALAYRVVHEEPDLTGVPAEISDLIRRCLAKDPAKRPTAADVLTELASAGPKMGWLPGLFTRNFSRYAVPAQAAWTAPVTPSRRTDLPSFPPAGDTGAITTAAVLGFLVVTSIALMETAGIGGSTTGRIPVGLIGGYSAGNIIRDSSSLQLGTIACFAAGLVGACTVLVVLGPIAALSTGFATGLRVVITDLSIIALGVLCFTANGAVRLGVIGGVFTLCFTAALFLVMLFGVICLWAVEIDLLPLRRVAFFELPADPFHTIGFLCLGGALATIAAAGLGVGYHLGIAAGTALGLGSTCGLALCMAALNGVSRHSAPY